MLALTGASKDKNNLGVREENGIRLLTKLKRTPTTEATDSKGPKWTSGTPHPTSSSLTGNRFKFFIRFTHRRMKEKSAGLIARFRSEDRRTPSAMKSGLIGILICFAIPAILADEPPDWFNYQIQFPPSPSGAADAKTSIAARTDAIANFMACGSELGFLHAFEAEGSKTLDAKSNSTINDSAGNGEDLTGIIVGKMTWLVRNAGKTGSTCTFQVDFHRDGHFQGEEWDDLTGFVRNPLRGPPGRATNARMADNYGQNCVAPIITKVSANRDVDNPDPKKTRATIFFTVTPACMRAQINLALSRMQQGEKQLGSSGLPCNGNPLNVTTGEWDVTVRDLTRILYLGNQQAGPLLDTPTRTYIEEQLISLSSPLGEASYSWLQCGDTEHATGSAEDRADEASWEDEAVDSIGEGLKWLAKRLFLFLLIFTAALVFAAIAGWLGLTGTVLGTAAQVAAVTAVVGSYFMLTIRIPESENHRLMIESSRFLKNERSISSLGPSVASNLINDQNNVKQFLMEKFKEILVQDFSEYNARPYQRYSLESLLNLADFSMDKNVQLGASMVLEYALTKFAIGSSQGRRLVPFRRLMDEVKCIMGPCQRGDHRTAGPMEELELAEGADHLTALGLFFAGQRQQLLSGRVSVFSAAEMVYAASSHFSPDPSILDLTINKSRVSLQRIHHTGFEIYSSGPSALITAGGIQTGPANDLQAGFITFHGRQVDSGAAVPTTIMLGRTTKISNENESRMTAPSYVRFEGLLQHYDDSVESFDHNLCVWKNFACGTNLRIPRELSSCLEKDQDMTPQWQFLNSTTCQETRQSPPFYLIVFRVCDDSSCSDTGRNAGLVEIIDAPKGNWTSFKTEVTNKNKELRIRPECLTTQKCAGFYHSAGPGGHDIGVNLFGHQTDSKRSGIESIDGKSEKDIDNWQFAEGDVITAAGDGLVEIKNARLGSSLKLDLRDINNPARR